MGEALYPDAKELMITADAGGSNGSRVRLWKFGLQRLAEELAIQSVLAIFHLEPASGIKSSIDYFRTSALTGVGSLLT